MLLIFYHSKPPGLYVNLISGFPGPDTHDNSTSLIWTPLMRVKVNHLFLVYLTLRWCITNFLGIICTIIGIVD